MPSNSSMKRMHGARLRACRRSRPSHVSLSLAQVPLYTSPTATRTFLLKSRVMAGCSGTPWGAYGALGRHPSPTDTSIRTKSRRELKLHLMP